MDVEQSNPMHGLTIRTFANAAQPPSLDASVVSPTTTTTTTTVVAPPSVTLVVDNGNVTKASTSLKKKSLAANFFTTNPTLMAGAIFTVVAVVALGAGLGAGLRSDTSSSSSSTTSVTTFTELAVNYNVTGPINNTVVSMLRCNLATTTTVDPSRITIGSWTERNGTVIDNETSLAVLNSPISSCGNMDTQAQTGAYLQAIAAAIVLPIDPISIGIEMLVDNTDPSESLKTVVDTTYTVLGPENVIVNLVTDGASPPTLLLPSATPSPSTSPSNTPSSSFGAISMNNWAAKGPSSMKSAGSMTCSDDGSIIYNIADGVYVSNDGGNTFSLTTLSATESWSDIACDANCSTVAVTSYNGTIMISTDSGNSFSSYGNSSLYTSISISDDGSNMVAVTDQDQIFISTDTGSTWSAVGNSLSYEAVTSSGDGQYIFAVGDGSQIQVSSDGGATWNQYGITADWLSIAASNDGKYVYAGSNTSGLHYSSNYGVTWNITTAPVSDSYSEIACSDDGRRVIVLAVHIFISENYFTTYNSFENSREWQGLAVSSDGLSIFSSVYEGSVYVAPAAAASPSSTSTSSASSTPSNSPTASITPSASVTPSTGPNSPSNSPTSSTSRSNTPTPSISGTGTGTPTPSPSYQPWSRISNSWNLKTNRCDSQMLLCANMYPSSISWIVGWTTAAQRAINVDYAPSYTGAHHWAVVPDLSTRQVFALPPNGNLVMQSTGGTTSYSAISSSTWLQFDVIKTSSSNFIAALTDNNAYVVYTNTSGASKMNIPVGRNMRAIDMTPSGSKILVGESNTNGRLFESTDNSSITFTLLPNAPVGPYKNIQMSDDGNIIYVNIDNSTAPLYYSTDAGNSWTDVGMNKTVNDIFLTSDGTFLLIASTDYAYNFNLTTGILAMETGTVSVGAGNRVSGAMSFDGRRRLIIGTTGTFLYIAPSIHGF